MHSDARGAIGESVLIIANPGTGKTTRLADRVVELLKAGASEKDILCITFTTKAAQEMREKIAERLKASGLDGVKVQDIAIHTFHSYAYDYLQSIDKEYSIVGNNILRYSIYKSFEANNALNYSLDYILSDIVPKTENAIRYLKSFGILPSAINLRDAERELKAIYKEEEIQNITIEENIKFLEYFKKAFEDYERLKPEGYIDYNDMLIKFIKKYDSSKRHYRYVLVDELQDVNELEAEIALRSGDVLFLVGDRKQSIFGFQGGSTRNFDKFMGNGIRTESLKTNYRSADEILDYAKAAFVSNAHDESYSKELEGLHSGKTGGKVKLFVADRPEIAAVKLAIGLAGAGNTAIITRTNSQLISISRILDSKGVDYTSTISNATSNGAKREIIKFLRGLMYDNKEDVLNALITPFSGVQLKEALEIAEKAQNEKSDLNHSATLPFFKMKESLKSIEDLQRIFADVIMPISLSIGKDYFVTASALANNVREFFETVGKLNREDLFHFLAVTEEDYEPIGKPSNLVLTTAHKAKGLEFDNVIYVPKTTSERFSFIDAIVYAIIKSSFGIDIRRELEGEESRIDFVAFTRARQSLHIVVTPKLEKRYYVDGLSEKAELATDDEPEPLNRNYDKAYAMFVAGRRDDASALLKRHDTWLLDMISTYFKKLDRLSFSLVEAARDPYGFMKSYILKLPVISRQLSLGARVHKIAEGLFNGTLNENELDEVERKYFENIRRINAQIIKEYGARQIAAEEKIDAAAGSIFRSVDSVTITGTVDAVYECVDGRRLIIDYKTDKTTDYLGEHKRQLSVYRKLYANKNKIDEKKIVTAVAYIGLSGKINTGRLDYMLEEVKPSEIIDKNVEKSFQNIMKYKKDPDTFIKDLLESKGDEMLLSMLKSEITQLAR